MLNYVQIEEEPKMEANLSNICLFESENGDGGSEQKCKQEGKYLIAGPLLLLSITGKPAGSQFGKIVSKI